MNKSNKGFSLIEMLVVIAIIAILSGALLVGFGRFTKSAQRAKALEAVSEAAQALVFLRDKNGNVWPSVILNNGGVDGEGKGMVVDVAKKFAEKGLLGISCDSAGNPIGVNRCGVVDPWAETVLKRGQQTGLTTRVPSGGTVQSHIIYYAVDRDGDGLTEAVVGGESIKVRASAIAWCAGGDGELAPYSHRGRSDDVYSWDKAKEKR